MYPLVHIDQMESSRNFSMLSGGYPALQKISSMVGNFAKTAIFQEILNFTLEKTIFENSNSPKLFRI